MHKPHYYLHLNCLCAFSCFASVKIFIALYIYYIMNSCYFLLFRFLFILLPCLSFCLPALIDFLLFFLIVCKNFVDPFALKLGQDPSCFYSSVSTKFLLVCGVMQQKCFIMSKQSSTCPQSDWLSSQTQLKRKKNVHFSFFNLPLGSWFFNKASSAALRAVYLVSLFLQLVTCYMQGSKLEAVSQVPMAPNGRKAKCQFMTAYKIMVVKTKFTVAKYD